MLLMSTSFYLSRVQCGPTLCKEELEESSESDPQCVGCLHQAELRSSSLVIVLLLLSLLLGCLFLTFGPFPRCRPSPCLEIFSPLAFPEQTSLAYPYYDFSPFLS